MDLHGLWRRLTARRSEPAPEPPHGPASSSTAGPPSAWRTLPPITPASGPAPLVAQRVPFEPGLEGAADTTLALAPLGHERSLHAPSGLVAAVHAPVVARTAEPLPGSVRPPGRGRRPVPSLPTGSGWPIDEAEQPTTPAPDSDVAPDAAAAPPAQVVARRVAAPPLTVAPPVQAPAGFVGGTRVAPSHAPSSARSPSAPSPSAAGAGGTGRPEVMAPGTAVARDPAVGVVSNATARPDLAAARSAAERPTSRDEAAALVGRHNLGQSRRLRIGPAIEPVAGPAAGGGEPVAMQRAVESTPDPMPQLTADPMPQLTPEAPVEQTVESTSAGLSVARSVASHADPEPLDRPAAGPASSVAGAPGDPLDRPAVAASSGPASLRPLHAVRPTIAPLLGTLRPTLDPASPAVAVARAAEVDEIDTAPTGVAAALAALNAQGGAPVSDGGPTVDRLADVPQIRPSWSDRAFSGPRAGPGSGSRGGPARDDGQTSGRVSPHRSASRGREPTGAAAEPFVARTVTPVASGPARSALADTTLSRGSSSGASGGTARLRVGPAVARSVTGGATAAPGMDGTSLSPTVAAGQSVAPSTGVASPTTVSRAVAEEGTVGGYPGDHPAGEGLAAAYVQRATDGSDAAAGPATGGAPGAPGGPTSGPELDALAARLYDRIRLRLRRELLADRERAGVLVDLGH